MLVEIVWEVLLRGGRRLDEVDEAVEDADLALELDAVDEAFVRDLDEVEAEVLEDEDGDVDCRGASVSALRAW